MFEAFLITALLSITDPSGDATGNGSLRPPSSEVYRNLAPFDLRSVTVTDDPQLTLRIEMGSLSDPFELPLGFSLPVIEAYVSSGEGGRNELLPGSGMRLPNGQGWEFAIRLTGEQATAYRVGSGTGGIETAPASVTAVGNELVVVTPFPRPDRSQLYALTGLYDLFGATPWRPVERQESPWAFSSESQSSPVIDVLAQDEERQIQAIAAGVLPPARSRRDLPGSLWLVLMALGLIVALAGVGVRILARRNARGTAADAGAAESETVPSPAGPVSWQTGPGEAVAEPDETARKAFTWDSSALLIEPSQEELDEELEHEFGASANDRVGSGHFDTADAWQRPIPLPYRPSAAESGTLHDEGGVEPEVVRDDEEKAGESVEVDDRPWAGEPDEAPHQDYVADRGLDEDGEPDEDLRQDYVADRGTAENGEPDTHPDEDDDPDANPAEDGEPDANPAEDDQPDTNPDRDGEPDEKERP